MEKLAAGSDNGRDGEHGPPREISKSVESPGVASQTVPLTQPPHIHDVEVAPQSFHSQQQQPSTGVPLRDALHFSLSPADTVASELWSTDFASNRWLGLLATDAAQADSGFSLAPSLAASPAPEDAEVEKRPAPNAVGAQPAIPNYQSGTTGATTQEFERKAWQSTTDITLTSHEAILFRHFAERSARWLDFLDPHKHFSTYAIRLALRNTGLMKAILALSAKHRAKSQGICPGFDAHTKENAEHVSSGGDNEWIRYYYETLHYVQEALAYNSYTHSEELLATAIVISAYEMLDESDGQGNWQRHLKGVFWIQRSQDVNGGSGGLRQSVWWAWLRQDVWAAFREKRHCLSFWAPVRDYPELDQHGLADRAIYLLSQAVNYCADSRGLDAASAMDPSTSMKRRQTKEGLLSQMARWKSYLGSEYKPLPSSRSPSDVFTPLWIHPPQFGVALQAYSFAQIIVTLYSPIPAGFNGYLKMQKTLSESVDTICGIAMELKDEGCQILSAQCLYGAGLCVQDVMKREKIIALMEACEARVGWTPMSTWRDDLRREWARADKESFEEAC